MKHCEDLSADRDIGQYWERQFCIMAARRGFLFTPMQIGRPDSALAYSYGTARWQSLTLPDVTIWTFPGQHHEIKHKNPTRTGCFGLEQYRFDALKRFAAVTQQSVLYTIHNHDLAGGRDAKDNNIEHWITADICALDGTWLEERRLPSWVNGVKKDVFQYFWPAGLWIPLADYWGVEVYP